ncbi:ExeM/NucH family extracellular endonuclease [Promineifilum sp.]|uniref:ExeM/NucH family extracellular endonuclease n=1 Tax=Promineifilum sp. TaxID=2664178 RepID=UPI0035B244ED
MRTNGLKLFAIALILALVAVVSPGLGRPAAALSSDIVISQVYGGSGVDGTGGNDSVYINDYVELFNRGTTTVSLSGMSIQYASATGTGDFAGNPVVVLSGSLAPGQYYLIQQSSGGTFGGPLPTPDATGTANLSGTSGKVALVMQATGLACNGGSNPCDAAETALIKDLVGYGTANYFEGAATPSPTNPFAIKREANGCTETDHNANDFEIVGAVARNTSSPFNVCGGGDAAPSVTGTTPADNATNVAVDADVSVTFSEAVNVAGAWYTISCATSGAHTATVSGGPTTFTLNPDADFTNGEVCTVTIDDALVTDQDGIDPPDDMDADYVFDFTVVSSVPVCDQPFTPIYDIQGIGATTPIPGPVVTEGVVVGDFQTSAGIQGFYIQEPAGDADPATSNGIFVYTGATDNTVSAGDAVHVTAYAREQFGQTTLNGSNADNTVVPAANIVICGTGSVTPVDVTLPFATATEAERYEGMLTRFPQTLVIAEYFNYDQFGEVVLALPLTGEDRPYTGTAIDEPGAAANARTLANSLRRITLDDNQGGSNPSVLRHPNGDPFSLTNRFRGGDEVQNTVGVLGYGFNLYRVHPTAPADYTAVNPRPAAPDAVGGSLRVAAMNTLNFFITADYPTGNPLDNDCGPAQNAECRGHDSDQPMEFTRQRDKLLEALAGLNADVIGLNEIENTTGVEPLGDPTNGIVAGLNAMLGAGTYAYIDTGVIGTDVIRVGLIYKPAKVTPVGAFQTLDSTDDPRFASNNRPALAQTFEEVGTGARFTVAVNHLKSKSCGTPPPTGADADQGDGQSCWNATRTAAAQALVDWLATDPTGSGDPDFLIMGDLNAYAMEDPIDAIKLGADDTTSTGDDYVNLIAQYEGTYAYSYTFDGQAGYLDHALAITSLASQVTGATEWHINSDEPDVVDYDTTFKPPAQEALYQDNPYRSSDHDAALIGLNLTPPADTTPPTVTINQAAGQADPTSASPINFTVVFSEPVTGFETGDVTLSGTAGATTATVTGSGATYNVAVSGMTGSGTVIASIAAGVAQDAATNLNTASTSTDNTVTYNVLDTTPPDTTITNNPPNPSNSDTAFFQYTSTEPGTNFECQLDNTGWTECDGGQVTYGGQPDGSHTFEVRAIDNAGNTDPTPASYTWVINTTVPDTTPPDVTINQASGQLDPTGVSPINFTVVFSEPVTGFATGDVTLSGTAGATTATVTGSGATYNVAVSGMTANGTVIATIAAGVAQDAAGNLNTASTSTDNTVTYNLPVQTDAMVFVSTTTAGTVGALSYGSEDILKWDGSVWTKWFDGSNAGLIARNAQHNINAIYIPDPNVVAFIASFTQNGRKVPGITPRVDGTDLVRWNGSAFSLYFDGSDVGLTVKTQEKIDGLHLLDPALAPAAVKAAAGGSCQAYLLISTQGPGKVPNYTGTNLNFRGEDVLGFCATNLGSITAGKWHMLLDGSTVGLTRNTIDSISASDDGQTLYFTTKAAINVPPAVGGHSMVYTYNMTTGDFSAPIFSAPAEGLTKKVDALEYVPGTQP